MKYCTYLTIYTGNRMPMFYIGYTRTEKISKGYHGSVTSKRYSAIWREELDLHPNLFKSIILTYHVHMKDAKERETIFQKHLKVANSSMYINSHIQGEHFCVDRTGVEHTSEAKMKMKAARQGRTPVKKGSTISDDHKQKISAKLKGITRPPEVIERIANSRRGRKNSKKFSEESNIRRANTLKIKMTDEKRSLLSNLALGEKNSFYGKHHSEETKQRLREVDRSYLNELVWWTNGTKVLRSKECPGDGFIRGRRKFNTL